MKGFGLVPPLRSNDHPLCCGGHNEMTDESFRPFARSWGQKCALRAQDLLRKEDG